MPKKRIIITIVLFLFVAVILFLMPIPPKNYLDVRVCPKKFPGTTEENIELMKKNLTSVANKFPDQELNGFVIFKEHLPIDRYLDIVQKYDIHLSDKKYISGSNSIEIYDQFGQARIGESLVNEHLEKKSFYNWLSANKYSPNSTFIDNFSANTTAEKFLKMWNENNNVIRAIGTNCTNIHYSPRPEDPIYFGGPSIFN